MAGHNHVSQEWLLDGTCHMCTRLRALGYGTCIYENCSNDSVHDGSCLHHLWEEQHFGYDDGPHFELVADCPFCFPAQAAPPNDDDLPPRKLHRVPRRTP